MQITIFLLLIFSLFSLHQVSADCENLYKIDADHCGQLCLSSTIAPFAVKFGGVTAGICSDQGFTQFDHIQQVPIGPFGNFDVKIYKKPASLLGDSNCENLYKINRDQCGQLCLSWTIAPLAVQFGKVTVGTCADQGFAKFDHLEKTAVGPFGNFDVSIYKKASVLLKDSNCENLYKVQDNQCGQLCVAAEQASYIIEFESVSAGTCVSQGFVLFDHSEQLAAGPFEKLNVDIYKKAAMNFLEKAFVLE